MLQKAKRPWLTAGIVWLSVLAVAAVLVVAGSIAMVAIFVASGQLDP